VDLRHAVTLVDLVPYTVYRYRVESGGAPLSGDFTFRSAAGPDQTGFTFVVVGDTRSQHEEHRSVVARILELAPDFVLHTGDLVARGGVSSDWWTFFEIERDLMARMPLFPALGNHEGSDPRYFDLFYLPGNERWYAFDCGNARFVVLEIDGMVRFDLQSEQYGWLEETLAANTQPWLFVAFHIPPYSSLKEDAAEIMTRETLVPLFDRYGVDIVFNGHHHNYQRSVVRGVTYIVAAGGGAPIYPIVSVDETLVAYANAHHAVHIRIEGDTLSGVAVAPEGMVLDLFTLP
jgi:3',5'-cyclic AMP phosphodiesterase CpdA